MAQMLGVPFPAALPTHRRVPEAGNGKFGCERYLWLFEPLLPLLSNNFLPSFFRDVAHL